MNKLAKTLLLFSVVGINSYAGERSFRVLKKFDYEEVTSSSCTVKIVRKRLDSEYDPFNGFRGIYPSYIKVVKREGTENFNLYGSKLDKDDEKAMAYKTIINAFKKRGYTLVPFTDDSEFKLVEIDDVGYYGIHNGSHSAKLTTEYLLEGNQVNDSMEYVLELSDYKLKYEGSIDSYKYSKIAKELPRCEEDE